MLSRVIKSFLLLVSPFYLGRIALFLSILFYSQELLADSTTDSDSIEAMLTAWSIPKSSKFYIQWSDAIQAGQRGEEKIVDTGHLGTDDEIHVFRHIQGKSGTKLPDPKEIPLPYQITEEEIAQKVKEAFENSKEGMDKIGKKLLEVPALPTCENSKTVREQRFGIIARSKNEITLSDHLFLNTERLPLDSDELFGKSVEVRRYTQDNSENLLPSYTGATCLPYRIKVTSQSVIKYEGTDALKNYDKGEKGVLKAKAAEILKELGL